MYGFYNRILNIDLTKQEFNIQKIDEKIYAKYLGGKGLASWLLAERNPKGVDPLSSANHLIFATGSVTGGMTWGSSRYGVFTKSPLTGFYAESYSGGKVPEAISATGFDAIVIYGKAKDLSLMEITPDKVIFNNADDLKGKDTFETEKAVKDKYFSKKIKKWKTGAVVVGPAAENGVMFSIIKNDGWRCAGRTGTGTVMGSKNLKAIVFSGDKERNPHDAPALSKLNKQLTSESKDHPAVHGFKTMGTSQMVKVMNTAKAFPTKYWTKGEAPHWEKISAEALHNQCDVTPHACAKCYLSCGRMTKVLQGRHKGLIIEGPEYETIYAFGGLCMIDSIEEIAYLNHLCDGFGMDTMTSGNLVAFTMAAFEKGYSDYEIHFGDVDATASLLKLISERKDIGQLLSTGIIPTAKAWGMEDQAVHVKGLEPAGYDPRIFKGIGLGYATSDRGACHLRSTFYKAELAGLIDPGQIEGKAKVFIDFEDRLNLFDTMILCKFYRDIYSWEHLGTIITASTGIDGSKENLQKIAQDVASKVREYNINEGMTKKDERLPGVFHKKLEGSGAVITEDELKILLKEYNSLRKWD
ncbi:MAG: aldehyde ferredoxin oxidoreductase family protein [Desulfobacterales bacterium]|nr:aldehyde ferredoxin oxidoreductase family protein [Desulfobacterales bacterium]